MIKNRYYINYLRDIQKLRILIHSIIQLHNTRYREDITVFPVFLVPLFFVLYGKTK